MTERDPETEHTLQLCRKIGLLVEGFDEVQAIAALTGAIAELVTTFRRQDRPDIVSDIARQLRVIVDAAGAAGR